MSVPAILVEGLAELGLDPSSSQIAALGDLVALLGAWSKRINLTAHRKPEAIARSLVLGAAALHTRLPPFSSLADLGSGAGFPGFPIAILRPDARFVLVESRQRRHHFQRAVARELDLQNVSLLRGRIEELPAEACEVVVAQALARPEVAVALMERWGLPGGWLVIPGSEEAPRVAGREDLSAEIRRYAEPLGGPARSVWIARLPMPS